MAGSLAALLGALAAWLALVLVFTSGGLGLAMTWRTWGGRLPGTERVMALFHRNASLDAAATQDDPDSAEEASADGAMDWVEAPQAPPAMAAPVAAPAQPPAVRVQHAASSPTPPAALPVVHAPASAAPSTWLDDHRAAGWDVVDEGDTPAAADEAASDQNPWRHGIDRASVAERRAASARPGAPLGPLVPTRSAAVAPPSLQGHPNDAALDSFGDPQGDAARGTRVIPIGPPTTTLGPDAELVEIEVDAPWMRDHAEDLRRTSATTTDPFTMGAQAYDEGNNPFAARPDAPEDDVDRMLADALPQAQQQAQQRATREATPPHGRPLDARSAPQPGTTPAPVPGRNVIPIGLPEPLAKEVRVPDAPGASPIPLVPAAPREHTLSRTEAIEELSAIYTISYEDACALLDVGLWGFENHEEWIRAVRGGGRPEGISEPVFQKVLSMPMRAMQEDLDKLRAKRKATQELEKMWGVGATEASALYDAGFTTLVDIREASVDQLARVPGINHSTAFMIKASAHGLAPDAH